MDVQDRILEVINKLGLNAYSFSKELSIDPSTIHKIVTGRRSKPSIDVLIRINKVYPNINLHWVLTGVGNMFFSTDRKEVEYGVDLLGTEAAFKKHAENTVKNYDLKSEKYKSLVEEQQMQIMQDRLEELNKMFDQFKKKVEKKSA
jgi:hypothetical protein